MFVCMENTETEPLKDRASRAYPEVYSQNCRLAFTSSTERNESRKIITTHDYMPSFNLHPFEKCQTGTMLL